MFSPIRMRWEKEWENVIIKPIIFYACEQWTDGVMEKHDAKWSKMVSWRKVILGGLRWCHGEVLSIVVI